MEIQNENHMHGYMKGEREWGQESWVCYSEGWRDECRRINAKCTGHERMYGITLQESKLMLTGTEEAEE